MPGGRRRLVRQCDEVQYLLHLAKHFATFNAIYRKYFADDLPARIFVCIPEWTGPFDIEIDCIAMV